jgi:two-component system NtrC family sensor kinase
MRWRIRHKLTLGLFLVGGIMALLLLGTFRGLFSYRSTMKTIDNKLSELKAAQVLQAAVAHLTSYVRMGTGSAPEPAEVLKRVLKAKESLEHYRRQLADTLIHGRDLDHGFDEQGLVIQLDDILARLAGLARKEPEVVISPNASGDTRSIDPTMSAELVHLDRAVTDLRDHIHTDLNRRVLHSKKDYRTSLVLVCCTSLSGVVFTLGLAQLAYRWIVTPIRDLHEKVGRLAQGNFDSRIEVHSGDEMQELAEAFNHMAERLQAIYRDLARQVNERSRQLVRSERLAGVGFLAAGVAHEINNPLASIAFCGEALERRLADLLNEHGDHPETETVRNYLKLIQQEAFRCKEITQRLLEFSRVGERQRQPTDLAELIQSVIDMVLHLQSYQGKHIVFQPAVRPKVEVNAPEIKSVVLNLVVNALESMDADGVLTIGLEMHEGMAEMRFADTGCGMTPEVLENIFEPFFTRSRTGKGTGLGLSISHRVVTQHGGEIEAASAGAGQGSTFTVHLPLTAPAEALVRAA